MSGRLKETMARVFEVPSDAISQNTSQETLDEWTSLSHLRLITELEHAFDVQFSMQDATELTSFLKLVEFLGSD